VERAQVLEVEKVEGVVDQRALAALAANGLLEPLEVRPAGLVFGHELAVDNCRGRGGSWAIKATVQLPDGGEVTYLLVIDYIEGCLIWYDADGNRVDSTSGKAKGTVSAALKLLRKRHPYPAHKLDYKYMVDC
jgi:hypothetical protein